MDMYDVEQKMEDEINEERANFAKDFLKRKRLELDRLDEEIGKLADSLKKAEEEYSEILGMSIDDVYDTYRIKCGVTFCAETVFRNFPKASSDILPQDGFLQEL